MDQGETQKSTETLRGDEGFVFTESPMGISITCKSALERDLSHLTRPIVFFVVSSPPSSSQVPFLICDQRKTM